MLAPTRGGSQQRFIERAVSFSPAFQVEVMTDLCHADVMSALAVAAARADFEPDLHAPVMVVLRRSEGVQAA
jgi:hypothetical protein